MGVPPNSWCIMENPRKMHDLGVPLFKETSLFNPSLTRNAGEHGRTASELATLSASPGHSGYPQSSRLNDHVCQRLISDGSAVESCEVKK